MRRDLFVGVHRRSRWLLLRQTLVMSPTRGGIPVSLRSHIVVRRQAFALEPFSTLKPSLSHPVPRRLARRITRNLSHLLTVGGMSQKFISRIHRGHDAPFWCPRQLRIRSELRHTCCPAFHGLARGIIVGALGDTQTPAIPIRQPGSLDIPRTGPTYRPSSTCAHRVPGSWLVYRRCGLASLMMNDATLNPIAAVKAIVSKGSHVWI
jgi:hypothetical protein